MARARPRSARWRKPRAIRNRMTLPASGRQPAAARLAQAHLAPTHARGWWSATIGTLTLHPEHSAHHGVLANMSSKNMSQGFTPGSWPEPGVHGIPPCAPFIILNKHTKKCNTETEDEHRRHLWAVQVRLRREGHRLGCRHRLRERLGHRHTQHSKGADLHLP